MRRESADKESLPLMVNIFYIVTHEQRMVVPDSVNRSWFSRVSRNLWTSYEEQAPTAPSDPTQYTGYE